MTRFETRHCRECSKPYRRVCCAQEETEKTVLPELADVGDLERVEQFLWLHGVVDEDAVIA